VATQQRQPAESVRIQSVDRAVDRRLALAAAPPAAATAPALARACGLNRATAWRLLKTLQIRGLVAVDDATGRYSIGLTVVELGNAAGPDALVAAAHPVLERTSAQTGETA
jgi:DNA-binding IclR family transcriptional regulator